MQDTIDELAFEGRWADAEFPIFMDAVVSQQKGISKRMTSKQRLLNTIYCGTVPFLPIFITMFVLVIAVKAFGIHAAFDLKTFSNVLQIALASSFVSYFLGNYSTKKLVRMRLKALFNSLSETDFKVTFNAEGRVVETAAVRTSIPWGDTMPFIKEYPKHLLISDLHKIIILTRTDSDTSLSEVAAQVKTWAKAKSAAPLF